MDGETGELLYGQDSAAGRVPASTTKLVTAAAALSVLGPNARLETKVVAGAEGDGIVLVGGGDPTLTADEPSKIAYPQPASLIALADRTATALEQRGVGSVQLAFDDALFGGPALATGWSSDYFTPGRAVVGQVSALAVDAGQIGEPGDEARTMAPAEQAAEKFAELLEERGIDVGGSPVRFDAPAGGRELASVASPPMSALVEQMLATSDNDLAEALARQVAIKSGYPATFSGGAQAVTEAIDNLELDVSGMRLNDGSGLSHSNQVSPLLLTDVLVEAARVPQLRSVLTGLAVAGYSGTLENRPAEAAAAGTGSAGVVRAKTGTLLGVNSLAGLVVDEDRRLLAFAVLADHVTSEDAAERALDRIAAQLASCGCR